MKKLLKKKFVLALLVAMLLTVLIVGGASAGGGGIIHIVSSPLHYSGTGWAGWSCPPSHPFIVDGALVDASDNVVPTLNSLAWKPGASVGAFTYPVTPFGYTYGSWYSGEQGWIAQNGGTPGTYFIKITCAATQPQPEPSRCNTTGYEVFYFKGTEDSESAYCPLVARLDDPGARDANGVPLRFLNREYMEKTCEVWDCSGENCLRTFTWDRKGPYHVVKETYCDVEEYAPSLCP